MTITEAQFRAMFPNGGARLAPHWPFVPPALARGAIDTPARIAAFLAQVAHESGEYRWLQELDDGRAYEGRRDLGNTQPGDGPRFKGHGPIQITGRANYAACGRALGIDLIAAPTLICTPDYATASAVWFWGNRKLSPLADRGWFAAITRIINGGLNGFDSRCAYYARNRKILGLPSYDPQAEDAAVREFQRGQGLTVDGSVGPITHAAVAHAGGATA